MAKKGSKVLTFPSPAPVKADYQRVKSHYTVREIKQLFGLSERLIHRWTANGVIPAASDTSGSPLYDFHGLTQFRRVRELRSRGLTLRQIEAELQGQMNLFRSLGGQVTHLLSPFEEALLLDERGDPAAAQTYRDAIAEGDNVAEAYCNLGIIELERGDTVKALDCFTLALRNEPRHLEAHYNLANLYFDVGEMRLARLHYETAANIEPGFSLVHYNQALACYRLNDLAGASAALRKYRDLSPAGEELQMIDRLLKLLEKGS